MHIGLITRSDVGYTLDLANDLHQAGIVVTVYMCHEHTIRETGPADRPIERLYDSEIIPRAVGVRLIKLPRRRDLRSFMKMRDLAQMIGADGLDVAHVLASPDDPWLAILPSMVREVAVVSTMIVPEPNVGARIPRAVGLLFNWLLARGSDGLIVNGQHQSDLVSRRYQFPADRIRHVPLSVRSTAAQWNGPEVAEEPGTVLFFGAARPHKGLEYLVRAQPEISRRIPSANFLISAHGDELARCRALIHDADKFEIIDRFVPGDEAAATFQRASLVVLPYLSASTSGVLMTAYSHARPVVATRVGCLPEYVQDGKTGFLVAPADPGELAEAISRLLADDGLRSSMQHNIARWLEDRREAIANQTIETYRSALAHKHHGRRP